MQSRVVLFKSKNNQSNLEQVDKESSLPLELQIIDERYQLLQESLWMEHDKCQAMLTEFYNSENTIKMLKLVEHSDDSVNFKENIELVKRFLQSTSDTLMLIEKFSNEFSGGWHSTSCPSVDFRMANHCVSQVKKLIQENNFYLRYDLAQLVFNLKCVSTKIHNFYEKHCNRLMKEAVSDLEEARGKQTTFLYRAIGCTLL